MRFGVRSCEPKPPRGRKLRTKVSGVGEELIKKSRLTPQKPHTF